MNKKNLYRIAGRTFNLLFGFFLALIIFLIVNFLFFFVLKIITPFNELMQFFISQILALVPVLFVYFRFKDKKFFRTGVFIFILLYLIVISTYFFSIKIL